jgi:hypothetical protein
MDIQYAQSSSVYTSDLLFQVTDSNEATPNTEMTLMIVDLDLLKNYEHVRILKDRRTGLYDIKK